LRSESFFSPDQAAPLLFSRRHVFQSAGRDCSPWVSPLGRYPDLFTRGDDATLPFSRPLRRFLACSLRQWLHRPLRPHHQPVGDRARITGQFCLLRAPPPPTKKVSFPLFWVLRKEGYPLVAHVSMLLYLPSPILLSLFSSWEDFPMRPPLTVALAVCLGLRSAIVSYVWILV